MPDPGRRLGTYADLLALPADARGELLGGEIVVHPSPTPVHQSTGAELYAELRGPFQRGRGGPGGWWLIPDIDVGFGPHDVCRPDIAGLDLCMPLEAVELELELVFPPLAEP